MTFNDDFVSTEEVQVYGSYLLIARDEVKEFSLTTLGGTTEEEKRYWQIKYGLYEAFQHWGAGEESLTTH